MSNYTEAALYEMTNDELRQICIEKGITGYSKANKDTLVAKILRENNYDTGIDEASGDNMFAIIASGCTRTSMPVAGMKISEVVSSYQEIFNIPDNATALVGGKSVSGSYVVKPGDNIEFIKPAGKKG